MTQAKPIEDLNMDKLLHAFGPKTNIPNIEIRAQGKLFLNSDFTIYRGGNKNRNNQRQKTESRSKNSSL